MKPLVILVHGLFRTRRNMRYLRDGIQALGYEVYVASVPTTLSSLASCVEALHHQLEKRINSHKDIYFVAHSMGGLIVREYLAKYQPNHVSRAVFIGTPHQGSRLASILLKIPLVSKLFKPLIDLQPSHRQTLQRVGEAIEIGLIIGTHNNLLGGKLFLSAQSDGRVEISSADAPDAKDRIEFFLGHDEIHFKKETLEACHRFLQQGHF